MSIQTFTAELWLWDARKSDTWTFVTVPTEVSSAIEDESTARGPRRGFGSVRVQVRIGTTRWQTSVFPDRESGCYVMPVKKAVRVAERIGTGDEVSIELQVE